MSFQRFQKPTTFNIVYTGAHSNFSPDALANNSNKDKVLFNDQDGNLLWDGFNQPNKVLRIGNDGYIPSELINPAFDEASFYDSLADFPITGSSDKWYVTRDTGMTYRWNGSNYVDFAVNLTNYYTKAQVLGIITGSEDFRDNVDEALSTAISNEITIRSNADTVLTNNLASESNTRSNAVSTLTSNLNAEISTRASDVSTEITNRINAIATVTSNLNNEISTRGSADTTLQTNINNLTSNLTTESNTRSNAVSTLTSNLNAEISTRASDVSTEITNRINAVATVTTNLNNEISTRGSADTTLQTNINNLTSNAFLKDTTGVSTINSSILTSGNFISLANGNVDKESSAGSIVYDPTFSPGYMTIAGVSVNNSDTTTRKVRIYDMLDVVGSVTTPLITTTTAETSTLKASTSVRTNNIRLHDNTDMLGMGLSVSSNGGNVELNVKGRLRLNDAGATDEYSIYKHGPFSELHIVGGPSTETTGYSKIVHLYDTLIVETALFNDVIVSGATTVNTVAANTINTANLTATAAITCDTLNVNSSSGINGLLRFDMGGSEVEIHGGNLQMVLNDIKGVNQLIAVTVNSTNLNSTNISSTTSTTTTENATTVNTTNMNSTYVNGVFNKNICSYATASFTAAGGMQTHTYNVPAGYLLANTQWTTTDNLCVGYGDSTSTLTTTQAKLLIDRSAGTIMKLYAILIQA